MSEGGGSKIGTAGWRDLTAPDAERVRDFYGEVAGLRPEPVEMGDYVAPVLHRGGRGEERRQVAPTCAGR